jgi:cysteinyl-tRNA synthetase
MALQIFNTFSRKKEEFVPLHGTAVGMYVCGPTVYGHSHLGHAKSYVSFDVIVRYLRFLGYTVRYVQNITDVGHLTDDADMGEDKIEKQSRIDRVHPMQLAETYTRSYFEDMDALGVMRPDISPRATGHIPEQISLILKLLDRGHAYVANGSVYFDVASFSGYGGLSGRSVEEMEAGARVEVKSEKRHPADFALWKRAEPGHILRWESPWGEGYPGWHVECSAMAMKYLGESIDIHGGGLENQFPHHECEIAQSEGSTDKQFVRYWVHNNMITVDGRKMGKSLGNFITLKDAFLRWSPQVVRFFILQSHYRSTLDFSQDAVDGSARGLEKLNSVRRLLRRRLTEPPAGQGEGTLDLERAQREFRDAMDDDFNSPRAIAVLFDVAHSANKLLAEGSNPRRDVLAAAEKFFETHAGRILGITAAEEHAPSDTPLTDASLVDLLISIRRELRAQKLWALSDRVRDGLSALGIVLEDSRDTTTWRKAPIGPGAPEDRPIQQAPSPAARAGGIQPELPKNVRTVFGDDDF